MEYMTIGMCIDYAFEYLNSFNEKDNKKSVRKATQLDFDNF